MSVYFTSDLHLGHEKVIGFCNRPFQTTEEMDEALVQNWNSRVQPQDTVYCLGDMCFHKPSIGVPILKRLAGNKILVQGNHDKYSRTQYNAAGFSIVMDEIKLRLNGITFLLSHYPYWDKDATDANDQRYFERRPIYRGNWLLCGHIHDKWKVKDKQINVGVDQWGYAPMSFIEIERIVRKSEVMK